MLEKIVKVMDNFLIFSREPYIFAGNSAYV